MADILERAFVVLLAVAIPVFLIVAWSKWRGSSSQRKHWRDWALLAGLVAVSEAGLIFLVLIVRPFFWRIWFMPQQTLVLWAAISAVLSAWGLLLCAIGRGRGRIWGISASAVLTFVWTGLASEGIFT